MAQDPSMEQTVSRAVRDNLTALQRVAEELNQAMTDLAAACSSSRPANALPAMLRAQTAAASLAASLEVMTRFVAGTSGSLMRIAAEAAAPAVEEPAPAPVVPRVPAVGSAAAPTAADAGREMGSEGGPSPAPIPSVKVPTIAAPAPPPPPAEEKPAFDVGSLSTEEQELHRRANRVAKVSMQDIKMLRPEQARLGREQRDICIRLRDDIEKAHREYDRRFRPILDHPVDYFYTWMVEILADGDPEALGEYPYSSSVLRR